MKKICASLTLAGMIFLSGCNWLPTGFSTNDMEKPKNNWDGSGFKRMMAVGTGIDPQAREIEKRLGYTPEKFF